MLEFFQQDTFHYSTADCGTIIIGLKFWNYSSPLREAFLAMMEEQLQNSILQCYIK